MQQHKFFRMDLRGQAETKWGVGADGNSVRYQWSAYDGMRKKWSYLCVVGKCSIYKTGKLGGTAEVSGFCPLRNVRRQKPFLFIFLQRYQRQIQTGKDTKKRDHRPSRKKEGMDV